MCDFLSDTFRNNFIKINNNDNVKYIKLHYMLKITLLFKSVEVVLYFS